MLMIKSQIKFEREEKIHQCCCVCLRNITFEPANKSSDGNNISRLLRVNIGEFLRSFTGECKRFMFECKTIKILELCTEKVKMSL